MIDLAPSPRREGPPPVRQIRLGFAGVGWIGLNRMKALAETGLAEIAAVFEPTTEMARGAAEIAGEAEFVDSFEALLTRNLDGIVIATPNHLHAAQAIAALQAGRAVFCQKPLGRNLVETRAIVAAARRADRLLGVDLSYRFTEGMRRIRDLIHTGALGHIYAVEAVFHNAYGPAKPWFHDAALAGGGCLLDLGIHLIDLALWALDFPAVERIHGAVVRRAPSTSHPRPVEDYAAAQISLAGDTNLQLACSWHAPAGCDAVIGATFFGTAGGAAFTNVNGSFYDFTADFLSPARHRDRLASPPDDWSGRATAAWCRQLLLSPAFDPEIARLEPVADALDRIYADSP